MPAATRHDGQQTMQHVIDAMARMGHGTRMFVDEAKFWEWHTKHATMWPSDASLVEQEAERRLVASVDMRSGI